MDGLKYFVACIVETLLRTFPFPTKTGLLTIGNPDRNSPVLLTCNFHLTVARVRRALRGLDAYLLIANSRGINVWCGAAGGHFTNHSIISSIKTTGIEELVDHRKLILPRLAAAGIEAGVVQERTGWKVVWGPVYAKDIPRYILHNFRITPEMRSVEFPLSHRIEAAASWAFPSFIIVSLILLLFWRQAILPFGLLIGGLSFFLFVTLPLYGDRMNARGKSVGFVYLDFGEHGILLLIWGFLILCLLAYGLLLGNFTWQFIIHWGFLITVVMAIFSFDLTGATPIYKSRLHGDRLFRPAVDTNKCNGDGICERVCPRGCYSIDKTHRTVFITGGNRCVQCGACVVQCPSDALSFRAPNGDTLLPETIRTFKLNLMGDRTVKMDRKNAYVFPRPSKGEREKS